MIRGRITISKGNGTRSSAATEDTGGGGRNPETECHFNDGGGQKDDGEDSNN